jgi:hypothetical protein
MRHRPQRHRIRTRASLALLVLLVAPIATAAASDIPDSLPVGPLSLVASKVASDDAAWRRERIRSPLDREWLGKPWHDEAMAWLDSRYADVPSDDQPSLDSLRTLIAHGCDDPFVMAHLGMILHRRHFHAEAEEVLVKTRETMPQYAVPAEMRAVIARCLLQYALRREHAQVEAGVLMKEQAQALFDMLREPGDEAVVDRLFIAGIKEIDSRLENRWEPPGGGAGPPRTMACLRSLLDADPAVGSAWARATAIGILEIDSAWRARGSGWASDVSDDGAAGFSLHLKRAEAALSAAFAAHPERPEAPAYMITVCMGSGQENAVQWFERALSAQPDYRYTWIAMRARLLPRWSGSHEEILRLGRFALATHRFDTALPFEYLRCLATIHDDIVTQEGRDHLDELWGCGELGGDLSEMFTGYQARGDSSPIPRAQLDSWQAACAWRLGRVEEARRLLHGLDEVFAEAFTTFDVPLAQAR